MVHAQLYLRQQLLDAEIMGKRNGGDLLVWKDEERVETYEDSRVQN